MDVTNNVAPIPQHLNNTDNMAMDGAMDVDMDMEIDFNVDEDPEVARLNAEAAALAAVRAMNRQLWCK